MATHGTRLSGIRARALGAAGLVLATLSCAPAFAWSLDLPATAVVAGPQVRLGDVARLSDEAAASAAAVVLGQAPQPGQVRVFTRQQIAARLRQAGLAPEKVAMTGRESVTVRRPGRLVSREEAEALYRGELARLLGVDPGRVTVSLVNWVEPVVAEGALTLSVLGEVGQVTRAAATGTLTGPVSLLAEGEPQTTLRPRAMVTVKVPAVVAREGLARGSVIGPGQVGVAEVDLQRLPEGALRTVDQALGRQAVRAVPPGTPLRRSDLVAPVVVRRGDRVVLTVELGALSLSVQGLALADGGVGEVIKVQNVQSRQTVEGLVRGAGEVLVVPGGTPASGL